jgi:small ligand-binding sensory domain FIST
MQSLSLIEDNYTLALHDLLTEWNIECGKDALAFLFVSPPWVDDLENITNAAQTMLGETTRLITVVGSGVIGHKHELEDSSKPMMSFFGGILPPYSSVHIDEFTNPDVPCATQAATSTAAPAPNTANLPFFATEAPRDQNVHGKDDLTKIEHAITSHSHIIFADPFFRNVQSVLDQCDYSQSTVAGAVTAASNKHQSTIAVGRNVLKSGSLIRASLFGNLGLQVVVSTGCRPIGPTYRVTSVNGPAVEELDFVRAVDQLEAAIESGCNKEDQALIRSKGIRGVLGGILRSDGTDTTQRSLEEDTQSTEDYSVDEQARDEATMHRDQISDSSQPEDFFLRQVTGIQPKSGSILVCGRPQVQPGDFFRFHIRSALSARKDWEKVVSRAKAERLFLGPTGAGKALGALQFSCAARGAGLFSQQDVDLRYVEDLLGTGARSPEKKVAGFFASAEIGPSRSSLRTAVATDIDTQIPHKTFLHGFATVVALICDYTVTATSSYEQMDDPLNVVGGILEDTTNSTAVWA